MAKKLPVAIDEDEFTLLIKNTKYRKHQVCFLLGFGSGLRISEVLKLERRDIDMNERKILIRDAKGGKDRVVPLAKGFKEKQLAYIPFHYKNLKSGARSLQLSFKRAAEKAGLLKKKPSLHFHSLRHGFATQLVKKGVPIHHIRTLMGHSNIATTNVYLEANPLEAIKSYEELF